MSFSKIKKLAADVFGSNDLHVTCTYNNERVFCLVIINEEIKESDIATIYLGDKKVEIRKSTVDDLLNFNLMNMKSRHSIKKFFKNKSKVKRKYMTKPIFLTEENVKCKNTYH